MRGSLRHAAAQNGTVSSDPERLALIVERLRSDGLIPPVKAVEVAGGGIIRVTISGFADATLRSQLTDAMGSTRWKPVETDQ